MSNVSICLGVSNLIYHMDHHWDYFCVLAPFLCSRPRIFRTGGNLPEILWIMMGNMDLVVFSYRFPWLVQVARSYSGETGQGQPGWQPMINIGNLNIMWAGHLIFGGTLVPLLQHKMWNDLKKRNVCDTSPIWMSASGKPQADVRQFLKKTQLLCSAPVCWGTSDKNAPGRMNCHLNSRKKNKQR